MTAPEPRLGVFEIAGEATRGRTFPLDFDAWVEQVVAARGMVPGPLTVLVVDEVEVTGHAALHARIVGLIAAAPTESAALAEDVTIRNRHLPGLSAGLYARIATRLATAALGALSRRDRAAAAEDLVDAFTAGLLAHPPATAEARAMFYTIRAAARLWRASDPSRPAEEVPAS